jgi:glucose-6-phosphate isomerase
VGIGGSALGPQFVAEALAPDNPPLKVLITYFDLKHLKLLVFLLANIVASRNLHVFLSLPVVGHAR